MPLFSTTTVSAHSTQVVQTPLYMAPVKDSSQRLHTKFRSANATPSHPPLLPPTPPPPSYLLGSTTPTLVVAHAANMEAKINEQGVLASAAKLTEHAQTGKGDRVRAKGSRKVQGKLRRRQTTRLVPKNDETKKRGDKNACQSSTHPILFGVRYPRGTKQLL